MQQYAAPLNFIYILYRHSQASVLVPALRTVGNIVTGDDNQTQIVINCNALSFLAHLLQSSPKKSIKKEACWTISNITAGTKLQIQVCLKKIWALSSPSQLLYFPEIFFFAKLELAPGYKESHWWIYETKFSAVRARSIKNWTLLENKLFSIVNLCTEKY